MSMSFGPGLFPWKVQLDHADAHSEPSPDIGTPSSCTLQRTTDFFDLVAFDRTAEIFEKHTKKGQKLIVDGRLRARAVLDEEDESDDE